MTNAVVVIGSTSYACDVAFNTAAANMWTIFGPALPPAGSFAVGDTLTVKGSDVINGTVTAGAVQIGAGWTFANIPPAAGEVPAFSTGTTNTVGSFQGFHEDTGTQTWTKVATGWERVARDSFTGDVYHSLYGTSTHTVVDIPRHYNKVWHGDTGTITIKTHKASASPAHNFLLQAGVVKTKNFGSTFSAFGIATAAAPLVPLKMADPLIAVNEVVSLTRVNGIFVMDAPPITFKLDSPIVSII